MQRCIWTWTCPATPVSLSCKAVCMAWRGIGGGVTWAEISKSLKLNSRSAKTCLFKITLINYHHVCSQCNPTLWPKNDDAWASKLREVLDLVYVTSGIRTHFGILVVLSQVNVAIRAMRCKSHQGYRTFLDRKCGVMVAECPRAPPQRPPPTCRADFPCGAHLNACMNSDAPQRFCAQYCAHYSWLLTLHCG